MRNVLTGQSKERTKERKLAQRAEKQSREYGNETCIESCFETFAHMWEKEDFCDDADDGLVALSLPSWRLLR